jgi:hypothetical protein
VRSRKAEEPAPTPPVPVRPRTSEEEQLVAAAVRPRLERAPYFRKEGEEVAPNGDRDLAFARLQEILHARDRYQASVTLEAVAHALGKTDAEEAINSAVAMVHGIGPQNYVETLLASQMAATHMAALEMLKRAQHPEQPSAVVDSCVTRATRLMRTFTAQVTALRDYRQRGHQTVTVQHVDVRDGGQAIVGSAMTLAKGGGSGTS